MSKLFPGLIRARDLLQLREVGHPQRRIVVKARQVRFVPCAGEMHFLGPGLFRLADGLEQRRKTGPVVSRCLRRFDDGQVINMGQAGKTIEDSRGAGRSNAGQQLKHPKPGHPIYRVLSPPQHAHDVLDVRGFQELEAAVFDVSSISSWAE